VKKEPAEDEEKKMIDLTNPEEKLAAILHHISEYIHIKLDNKELQGQYTWPRSQLY